MTSARTKRILQTGGVLALTAGAGVGIFVLLKYQEERGIYREWLQPVLTDEADREYNDLPLFVRRATALRGMGAVAELRETDWDLTAKGLRPADTEDAYDLVFRLGVGDSVLHDCVVTDPYAKPAGFCESFAHVLPDAFNNGSEGKRPTRKAQNVPLEIHFTESILDRKPYAASMGRARLTLGAPSEFQFEARVKVDDSNVLLTEAALLVPDPMEPESTLVPMQVADFSPRTTIDLRTVNAHGWKVEHPMPALLSPFFGEAPTLTVFRADAVVEVSLLQPGYRLEGRLVVLNQEAGAAIVEYRPGEYMSFAVRDLSIPAALPNVCFNIESALLELEMAEKRLRLAGSTRIDTVDSFLCREGGFAREMGFFTRHTLSLSLNTARTILELPESLQTYGHFVMDWDDGILCGDMGVNGQSLLHAAYLGNEQAFQMWAPKGFTAAEVSSDRILGSTWDVLAGFWNADWGFPTLNPRQCWDGDRGPRTDMNLRLLPEWQGPVTMYQAMSM